MGVAEERRPGGGGDSPWCDQRDSGWQGRKLLGVQGRQAPGSLRGARRAPGECTFTPVGAGKLGALGRGSLVPPE